MCMQRGYDLQSLSSVSKGKECHLRALWPGAQKPASLTSSSAWAVLRDPRPPADPLWSTHQVWQMDYAYKTNSPRPLNIPSRPVSCHRGGSPDMKGVPSSPERGAARNTEAGTQRPTFSRLYLKGTAKPTLETAYSLLSRSSND